MMWDSRHEDWQRFWVSNTVNLFCSLELKPHHWGIGPLTSILYTPAESGSCYGMTPVVRRYVSLSVNIWHSTGVTTWRIEFNFTDIIHLMHPIHDTGSKPCSSWNICKPTQLLIFAIWSFLKPYAKRLKKGTSRHMFFVFIECSIPSFIVWFYFRIKCYWWMKVFMNVWLYINCCNV